VDETLGIERIYRRIKELRSAALDETQLICELESEIQATEYVEEKVSLLSELSTQLHFQGRLEEAEAAIKTRIALQPDLPGAWIRLSLHHLYCTENFSESFRIANIAIAKAHQDGNFLRLAHLERIRTSLKLGRFDSVQESLDFLTTYIPSRGCSDSALEGDFLKHIPPGAVDTELIQRYEEMRSAETELRNKWLNQIK